MYGWMSVLIVGVGVDVWHVWVYMCICMVCVIECCVLLLCMCGVGGWEWASGVYMGSVGGVDIPVCGCVVVHVYVLCVCCW